MDDKTPSLRARVLRTIRDVLLGLAAIAVLSVVVGRVRAPSLPEVAPAFTLLDLAGEEVSLEDFRGQVVVLNFWAEWCGPCRLEIPTFSRYARNRPDVVVLGIATDGTAPRLRAAARRLDIAYPVLVGDPETVSAYEVSSLPTTVIVGPEGDIRTVHAGVLLGPQLAWTVWMAGG